MIKDIGGMGFEEANDANIPVCIFISEPSESETAWELTANNYMPRKNWISEGEYKYQADSRQELYDLVQKFVVPLYRTALEQLTKNGELYYWQIETDR